MQPPASSDARRAWHAAQRVLAVRLDNLGDVLMMTPALAAIAESLPGARLDLLTSPSGAALVAHLPMVSAAIAFQAPWVKASGVGDEPAGAELQLVERLTAARYDAAVIFTTCSQSALPAALLCRIAGIPLRLAHCRENPYALLSDWVADDEVVGDGMRHEVARQLALVAHVGFRPRDDRLVFALRETDRRSLARRLAAAGIDAGRPYIVVHPGATAASRRYPAPLFGSAAELIARRSGRGVVFTGDASERALVDEARGRMTLASHSLAGDLSLGELAALIDGADLVVANNTGPAHIAAALATPLVDLYALTNPQHTPWRAVARVLNHDVPCRNCLKSVCPQGHHDCLRRVDPAAVAAAAFDLLGISAVAAQSPRQDAVV